MCRLWAAVPLLIVIAFGAGYAVQYAVLNRVSGRDPLPSLVVTFGLSIVIQNLLQECSPPTRARSRRAASNR